MVTQASTVVHVPYAGMSLGRILLASACECMRAAHLALYHEMKALISSRIEVCHGRVQSLGFVWDSQTR